MTLSEAIERDEEKLQGRGYDGLYLRLPNENCGCGLGNLRPCGEVNTGCRPARIGDDGMFHPTLIRRKVNHG